MDKHEPEQIDLFTAFNIDKPPGIQPPTTLKKPKSPSFEQLCYGLDFGDRTPPEYHPVSGRKMSRKQLKAFAEHRHQYEPCRREGCDGIIACKSSPKPLPNGQEGRLERYTCHLHPDDHYNCFVNDGEYRPETREYRRFRTERDLTCPCGVKGDYRYLNTAKNEHDAYYMCLACNKRFVHDRETGETRYADRHAPRASREAEHTCPECGSTKTKQKGAWKIGDHAGHQRQCLNPECGHIFKIAHLVVTPAELLKLETKTYELEPIQCAWCGDEFTPTKSNQRYCSPQHKKNADMRQYRANLAKKNAGKAANA